MKRTLKAVLALVLAMCMIISSVFAAPMMAGTVDSAAEVVDESFVEAEEVKATVSEEDEKAPEVEAGYDAWDGGVDISWYNDSDSEFTLTTAEQFAGFAFLVNGAQTYNPALGESVTPDFGYYCPGGRKDCDPRNFTNGNSFEGKTVKLGTNLDFLARDDGGNLIKLPGGELLTMMPVGFSTFVPFKGTFDGNGYTIKNIFQGMWDALGMPVTLYKDGDRKITYENFVRLGVFGVVEDATIKNLTVDNISFNTECVTGGVAGQANGSFVFEDITVKNSVVGSSAGWRAGGLIGQSYGDLTVKDVTVGDTVTVAQVGGNYDTSVGGILGAYYGDSIAFENCSVSCKLDVFSDCVANYDTGVYRNCGMVIGGVGENDEVTIDSKLYPHFIAKNTTFKNVNVTIGDWANYTYCWSYALDHNCQRIEPGVGYKGVDVTTVGEYSVTRRRFDAIFGAENAGDLNNVRKEVDYKTMNFLHGEGYIDADSITVVGPEVISLDGEGTKDNPYLIKNLSDLEMFRDAVNAGMTYEGEYFRLAADIDLTGKVWTPIGISNYDKTPANAIMFAGNFDGGNHTITGLSSEGYVPAAYETESTEYSFGLFGYVYGADISNINLADVDIDCGTIKDSYGRSVYGSGVAALIGYYHPVNGKKSVIENCHVLSGEVKASNNMGGLIGHMDTQLTQPTLDITIKNCSNAADVTTEAREAGGILGLMNSAREGNYLVTARGTVVFENCVNTGDITSLGGGSPSAGGILGRDHNQAAGQRLKIIFDGCESSGTITVTAIGETHAAGIGAGCYSAGAWLIANKCVNTGDVVVCNSENNNDVYAGGLISYGGVVEVIDSESTGTVTGGTANNKYVGGAQNILFLERMYDFTDTVNGYTYYLNGGISPEYDALVDDAAGGGNFHLVEKAYKDGFEFGGWYDNAELTGSAYTALDKTKKNYYAKWNGNVATVNGVGYPTFAEALEAAAVVDGAVTVELNADVEWETGNGHGSTPLIPAGSQAEVTIDGNGYRLVATGAGVGSLRAANGKKLTFNDMEIVDNSVSYDEGAWEFTYLEFAGVLEFNDVDFLDEIQIQTEGDEAKADVVFNDCTFESNESSVYALWICDGDVEINGGEFNGYRAVKVHEYYGSEVDSIKASGCTFNSIEKKPAFVFGDINANTTITIENCVVKDATQAGDQGAYLYESDTDVTTFNFATDNNTVYDEDNNQLYPVVTITDANDNVSEFGELNVAIANVDDGDTITLHSDITIDKFTCVKLNGYYEGVSYVGDKSFTIDLGGYKVTNTDAVNDYLFRFENNGSKANTINIKNGTIEAASSAYCALATAATNAYKMTINLDDVTLIGNNSNGAVIKVRGGSELNVKAGTVVDGKDSYVGIECVGTDTVLNVYDDTKFYQRGTTSYVGSLVGVSYGATANVYGGYGESAMGGIIVMTSGGTINVEGGEWIADTGLTGSAGNYSVLIAQNDKISYPSAGKSVINVTGGAFSGKYNCYVNAVGDSEINISGGKYSEEPTAYLAEGYQALYLENLDYWTVTKKWKVNVNASDNELYEGETVTITVSFDGEKYSNAGYTLTWDTDLFEYVADSLTTHAKDVSEAEVEKHSDLVDDEGNMLWDDYIDYEKGVIKNVILSEDGDDVFNVDGNDVVATYTFKAKAQEKEEDCYYEFVLDSAYANNKEMASSIDSVPALIGDAEKVTIKLRETTIKVMLGGTTEIVADTEGKYRFDYNGYEQEVSVVVTNPATGDYETL